MKTFGLAIKKIDYPDPPTHALHIIKFMNIHATTA